uniref:Dirigent protein n=1 Tax=Oryza brachyantha TaxID=4533 RepID=J3NCA4_ORYBR
MASASFSIIPSSALMEGMEFSFCNLYLHHTYGGPKPNQSTIVSGNGSTGLGSTVANNWVVYDGLGSDAKAVAHAQGLHIYAGNWHNSFSLVMGVPVEGGEWSIVGGTGEFAMASGVIYKKVHERRPEGNIIELTVHGFCTSLKGRKFVPIKVGPWGGNGGTPRDIKRLQRG